MNLIIIILLTITGAKIFERIMPGARLMGPLFAVGLVNILGGSLRLASWWEILFSVILGTFFGLRIERELVADFKKLIIPLLLLIFWYIGLTIINGQILLSLSGFDRVTSFLAVIPGGLGEVSIMALDYNADLMAVTSFQVTRLVTIILLLPFLARTYAKRREGGKASFTEASEKNDNKMKMVFLIAFSLAGALLFWKAGLPAGFLTGSLTFSAVASVLFPEKISKPPEKINNFAQLGMGALIGTTFTRESFLTMIDSYLIVIAVTAITIFSSVMLAYLFSKMFKWDYLTCFLGVVPGGIAPIMIMADQIEIDIGLVAVMQIMRLITAIMIIPFLYMIII